MRNDGAYLWQGVPAAVVADLVEDFLVHPLNHDFQGDSIAAFLRETASEATHPWATWKVVLPRKGTDSLESWTLGAGLGLSVTAKRRRILVRGDTSPASILVSGRNARVGSKTDVLFGLTEQEEAEARIRAVAADPKIRGVPEDIAREVMQTPLLVIYLVRGELEKGGQAFDSGLILPALGLHFPGRADPDSRKRYVVYRLNRVAQEELSLGDDDIPVDDDIDD